MCTCYYTDTKHNCFTPAVHVHVIRELNSFLSVCVCAQYVLLVRAPLLVS